MRAPVLRASVSGYSSYHAICSYTSPLCYDWVTSQCHSFAAPPLDKGIFWAGIGGGGRSGGPAPRVAGPGAAGATGQRQCEVGHAPERQNCLSGGRVMRRTEAAGVWRERWRSAMWVPRRGRGWVQVPPGCTRRRRVLKSGPGVGRSHTQAHR